MTNLHAAAAPKIARRARRTVESTTMNGRLVLLRILARMQSMESPTGVGNAIFRRSALAGLARQKRQLECFDEYLYASLNSERLVGQIVFEYCTLLASVDIDWGRARVLDVGSGRSTFPTWMAVQGASVVCFEYPDPLERQAAKTRWDRRNLRNAEAAGGHRFDTHGSMLELPFRTGQFDVTTSFSVVEHLDTDLQNRTFVPYSAQRTRLSEALSEMVRVTRPGGLIYITSDALDYERQTDADRWREHYYFEDGPELSGAWPARDVPELFWGHLRELGCEPVGPISYDCHEVGEPDTRTFRGDFFSAFSVLVRTPRTD